MKEQVILEREEYLKLKELADKTKEDISNMEKSVKTQFLKNIFYTIYTGVSDGYHEIRWGVSDWDTKIDKEWSDWLKWAKGNIEREGFDDALGCIQRAIKEIVIENIEKKEDREMTKYLYEQMQEKIKRFNTIPWYKKMFFKLP